MSLPKSKFAELVLTCGSWHEAQQVADALLESKLVASVEFLEVKAEPWLRSRTGDNEEIKLILHSAEHLLDKIEAEIKQLLGRADFALQTLPGSYVPNEAKTWLQEVIEPKG